MVCLYLLVTVSDLVKKYICKYEKKLVYLQIEIDSGHKEQVSTNQRQK